MPSASPVNAEAAVRRRWPRRVSYVAVVLIVAVLSSVGTTLWHEYSRLFRPSPPPPLAQGLSRTFTEASAQFDQRIRERFPMDSLETELIGELRGQGFKAEWTQTGQPRQAAFTQSGFPCVVAWVVSWNANEVGRLTAIQARVWPTCA
jgi:hypothetical protein